MSLFCVQRLGLALGLIFVIAAGHSAHSEGCLYALLLPGHAKLFRHVDEFNPKLLMDSHPEDLQSLYLVLKAEEALVNQNGVTEGWVEHFRASRKAKYIRRLGEMGLADWRIYYLNALHTQIVLVAEAWTEETVAGLAGELMLPPDTISAGTQILETFFSPYTLRDRELTPQRAAEGFAARSWEEFPWTAVLQRLSAGEKEDFSDIGLSARDEQRVVRVLNSLRTTSGPMCCRSSSACKSCPHNRYWSQRK